MERILNRFAVLVVSLLAAAIVVVAGVAFLCAALYLALLGVATPPIAALATGLVAFTIALSILLAAYFFTSRPSVAPERRRGGGTGRQPGLASALGKLAGDEIGAFVRNHPAAAVQVFLLAGFAIGFSPNLRRALRDLLEP
jgi:hypothetical protein